MSSIPPKNSPSLPPSSLGGKANSPALQNLHDAMRSADVGNLHTFLFAVTRHAKEQPAVFQQVFAHLHQMTHDAASKGSPMPHKSEVTTFLKDSGRSRLETLTKEILHPSDSTKFQAHIAEAKWLLAAGYGGKDTAKLSHAVDLRSYGQAKPQGAHQDETSSRKSSKGVKSSLKDAFATAGKSVAAGGQSTLKQLGGALRKMGPKRGEGGDT